MNGLDQPGRVKVLYIAGWKRSGSTILSRVLGEARGFVASGELWDAWKVSFSENTLCGCGRPFDECQFWRECVETAFGPGPHSGLIERMIAARPFLRTRRWPLLVTSWGDRRHRFALDAYRRNLEALYDAIRVTAGATVVVDSSKLPVYAHVLGTLPRVDLRVVHLVRDARAVAYSGWRRRRYHPDGDGRTLNVYRPSVSASGWMVWNVAVEALCGRWGHAYYRLRYEDLVAKPKSAVQDILDFVSEPGVGAPVDPDGRVELSMNHTVFGNPVRMTKGPVELRLDREWRHTMPRRERYLVTALTWPLLHRYGYLDRAI